MSIHSGIRACIIAEIAISFCVTRERKEMVRRLAFVALLTAGHAHAQQIDTARIDKIFQQFTTPNTPGCVLGIGRAGVPLYQRGYGMSNLEYEVPLTERSIVEIGSVSKQFTAAAILLLAQRGVLSLDDDIRKWLPEVPDFGRKITVRMLANHTSGLRDQWGLLGMMNSPPGSAVHTPELILDLVSRQRELNFHPNDQYLYSNTGYTLLGIIVKRASGKSLAEFSIENIFQPLGMRHTQWRDDFTRVVKGRATAYSRERDGSYHQDMPFTNVYGNGGLLTTVGDLIIWWDALRNNRLGDAQFVQQLTTSGVLNSGHRIGYALGVSNSEYRGSQQVTHSGSTAGYRAYLTNFPQTATTVAVLCNNASANAGMLAQGVVDVVLADRLAPVASGAEKTPAANIDLSGYAGLYRNVNTDAVLRFEIRNGRLAAGSTELIPTGTNTFHDARRNVTVTASQVNGTTQLRFPDPDAEVVTLEKVGEARPDAARLREYAGKYRSPELDIVVDMVVKDDRLVATPHRQRELTLSPTYADAFVNSGNWIFTRGADGKVNGMFYSQGRVRRVRFEKIQ